MGFNIIDGGYDTEEQKSERKKNEQLLMLLANMREIEKAISIVESMAADVEWYDFLSRLQQCRKNILDTLSFVKRSNKMSEIRKTHLKVRKEKITIVNNKKDDEKK